MKYEKAMVEVIAFDKNREFLGWVPSGSNNNDQDAARREGEARARSLMGWNNPNDQITVQIGYDGQWMAYCTFVGGQAAGANQIYCNIF